MPAVVRQQDGQMKLLLRRQRLPTPLENIHFLPFIEAQTYLRSPRILAGRESIYLTRIRNRTRTRNHTYIGTMSRSATNNLASVMPQTEAEMTAIRGPWRSN